MVDLNKLSLKQQEKIEKEINEKLSDWKEIVSRYQVPDFKKAVVQILNSFGPYIALWVLMYYSLDWSIYLTIALGVVNAFFLVRIFIIQHDCGHQSFMASKNVNNIIGVVCSVFSTLPYKYWAKVHNHHHGHTGQLEERDIGDIDFLTVEEYRNRTKWGRMKYRMFRWPIVTFFFAPIYYLIVSNRIVFNFKNKPWKKAKIAQIKNNILILLVYSFLGYFLGWYKFLFIQLYTILLFSIIAFWFFYVQHQHENGYQRWRKEWTFLVASIRGASYYDLPRVWQWLTGNIGIHHIHHLSSLIPNYNLEKCMIENPKLSLYVNRITFIDSLSAMRNKLWSEDLKKMVTWREYKLLCQKKMN